MIGLSTGGRMGVALVCCAVATFAVNSVAFGDGKFRTVALSETFGTDAPFGFRFPALNNHGEVAFSGIRGSTFTESWFVDAFGGNRLVAGRGNPVPGLPAGPVFDTVGSPLLNNSGQVALVGRAMGLGISEQNAGGLWTEDGASNLQLVVRTGAQAPGTPPGVVFDFVGDNLFNDSGHSAIGDSVRGIGINDDNKTGIWWNDGAGNTSLVVRGGDHVPGLSSDINFRNPSISGMSLNDGGKIAFRSFVTGASSGNSGIWLWEYGQPLTQIARRGEFVPGEPTTFGALGFDVRLNNSGDVAFFDSRIRDRVWVRQTDGEYRLIAEEGDSAPGTMAGVSFLELNDTFEMNKSGHIAIWASLTGIGVSAANNEGIWREDDEGLHLVVRLGDQAPGTSAGVHFSNLGQPTINGIGQVAFPGYLSGVGVTDENDFGFWALDRNGILQLLIREGDEIDTDDGIGVDLKTIRFLEDIFRASGNEDGRPSVFNDAGQFVFVAGFTDSQSGVFVSNAAAAPEPCSLILIAQLICLMSILTRCRTRWHA
jgi:hypothetical protein